MVDTNRRELLSCDFDLECPVVATSCGVESFLPPVDSKRRENMGKNRRFSWSSGVIFLSVVALCLLSGVKGDVSEYFRHQPQDDPYYLTAGIDGPWLDCSVLPQYTTTQYRLQWIKVVDGKPRIISIGHELQSGMSEFYDLDTSSNGSGTYNLRIKTVSFENDNGVFYCQISGGEFAPAVDSKPAEVVVLVKPGSPQITKQPDTPISEGSRTEVKCQSIGGNPAPTFTWYFSNGTKIDDSLASVDRDGDVSTGRLSWVVSAHDHQMYVRCTVGNRAVNRTNGSGNLALEVGSKKMQVLYPPKVRVGPVTEYNVEKGTLAQLECVATANPPPLTYRWRQTTGLSARQWEQANVSFIADKDYTGNYSCQVSNTKGTGQAFLQLNVLYEPQIYVQKTLTVAQGDNLRLTCNVDAKPDSETIYWEGPDDARSNSAVYEIASVTKQHKGVYTCTAKNVLNLYVQGLVSKIRSGSTEVLVSYAPGKGIVSIETRQPIIVGDSVTLNCAADDLGHPDAQYRWRLPGSRDYQYNPQSSYTLVDVKLSNAGRYHCMPFNNVGDGTEGSIMLEVNEPASLDSWMPTYQEFSEGATGPQLACSARGHPAPQITWYKDGLSLVSEETGDSVDSAHWMIVNIPDNAGCHSEERCSFKVSSELRWQGKVRWDDKGIYTCSASNGMGSPHAANMTMVVRHKPVIVNAPSQSLAAANYNEDAKIECLVSARPEPSFRWFHKSTEIHKGGSYNTETFRNETYDVYSNVLKISSVGEADMGDYMCKAHNEFGEDTRTFTLKTKTKPEQPSNLRKVAATHTSIVMAWDPGFDGGYRQSFQLVMHQLDPMSDQFLETGEVFGVPDNLATYVTGRYRRNEVSLERSKRFLAAEKPRVTKNVTNLSPLSRYMFRVKASNKLGETDWLLWKMAKTKESPISERVTKPSEVNYNAADGEITFKVPVSSDLANMCLMIYVKGEAGRSWRSWGCVKSMAGKASGLPTNLDKIKVRFCMRETMICSNSTDALIGTVPAGIPWKIVLPIFIVLLLILIVVGIVCICGGVGVCLCCRRKGKKVDEKLVKQSRLAPAKQISKDYEMETNQARPTTISAPYLTSTAEKRQLVAESNAQAPRLGIGGSQADSGVFTMGSHYQYDAGYGNGAVNGGYSNGAMHTSYDNGGDDRWGSAADPYGEIDPFGNGYVVQQPGDFGDVVYPDGLGPGYSYYDPYGNPAGMVDLNPNGTLAPGESQDESLNSGYSTPSNRRIMREIIV